MAAVDAPPRAVEDDAGATTLTWAEATMLELERSLSHEGRAALAFEGRSGLASLRSTLKALGAFESLRSRVDRAADALDRGVPLERASSARSSRPSRHGSPVKRMNSAPRLGRGRSSSDAGRRAPLEVPGATPVDDGAEPAPATPRPPSAGLEALSRSLSMTPGDSAARDPPPVAGEVRPTPRGDAGDSTSGPLLFSWGRASLLNDEEDGKNAGPLRPVERFASRRTRVVACATSGRHALAVDDEGCVYASGANEALQCDANRPEHVPRAVRVESLPVGARVVAVACGAAHSACVTSSGRVLCWGGDDRGQVSGGGNPARGGAPLPPRPVGGALQRCVVAAVACGDAVTVALTSRFEVFTWGAREACGVGLAGDGAAAASSCRRVDALVGVPVVGVDCGGGHCVAVTATGEAWAWGRDEHRQCGVVGPLEDVDGDAVLVPGRCAVPPDFRVDRCCAGRAHTLFLTRQGRVLGCGRNHAGQLGLNDKRDQPEPVPCFASLGGAAVVVAVAAGDAHSLAALSSGGLRAFGADRAGACSGGFSQLSKEEHVVPLPEHRHAFHVVAGGDASLALARASDGPPPAGAVAPKGGRPFWADGATDLTKDGRKASRVDSFLASAASARPIGGDEAAACGAEAAAVCFVDAGDVSFDAASLEASAKRDAALDRLADVLSWPSLLAASFVAEDAPRRDDFYDDDDDDDDGDTRFDDVRFDARAFERCFAPLDAVCAAARSGGRGGRAPGREDAVRRKLALAIMAGATRLASAQRDARSPDAARCCVALAAAAATVRAGKESEIPNFKGSYLGRFPLVSADFWTSDHLSERSRSMDACPGTRVRGTLMLKRT